MKIKYEDMESGVLLLGLQIAQLFTPNWHARVALAGHHRRLKVAMREPLAQRRDILTDFGEIAVVASRKYPGGRKVLDVNPDGMDKMTFARWREAIRAWRESALEYDFDSGRDDGKLKVEMFAEDIAQIPPECLEAMVDYVVFEEAQGENPNKDKKRIQELQEKLALAKASAQDE